MGWTGSVWTAHSRGLVVQSLRGFMCWRGNSGYGRACAVCFRMRSLGSIGACSAQGSKAHELGIGFPNPHTLSKPLLRWLLAALPQATGAARTAPATTLRGAWSASAAARPGTPTCLFYMGLWLFHVVWSLAWLHAG